MSIALWSEFCIIIYMITLDIKTSIKANIQAVQWAKIDTILDAVTEVSGTGCGDSGILLNWLLQAKGNLRAV